MFIKNRFITVFDKFSNTSKVIVYRFDDGGLADTINDTVSRNVLPWTCFIIVTVCLLIIVTKLRSSAKFRLSMSANDSVPMSSDIVNEASYDTVTAKRNGQLDAGKEKTETKVEKAKSQVLSSREVKILRSIILVAVIFVICQIPLWFTLWQGDWNLLLTAQLSKEQFPCTSICSQPRAL